MIEQETGKEVDKPPGFDRGPVAYTAQTECKPKRCTIYIPIVGSERVFQLCTCESVEATLAVIASLIHDKSGGPIFIQLQVSNAQ